MDPLEQRLKDLAQAASQFGDLPSPAAARRRGDRRRHRAVVATGLVALTASALVAMTVVRGGSNRTIAPPRPASSTSSTGGDTLKGCLAKADTTLAMQTCVITEHGRVDAELNLIYGQLAKKLNPSRKALLVSEEKGWIAYRDDKCKSAASAAAGGSLAPVIQGQCLIDLTVQRTKVLRGRLASPLAEK